MKKPQAKEPTPAFYEPSLHIDESKINEMCVEQPEAFYRVAKELVYAKSRRDQAKQDLREEEAEADARIRYELEARGDKVTVDAVNSKKVLDKRVRDCRDTLMVLETQVGEWEALADAFRDRSFMLRECMKYHLAHYFGTTGTLNEVRDEVSGATKPQRRR